MNKIKLKSLKNKIIFYENLKKLKKFKSLYNNKIKESKIN